MLSNINEDTIVSYVKAWNDEICMTKKDIELLSSETFKKLKRKDIIGLVGQFDTLSNELLSSFIIAVPQV